MFIALPLRLVLALVDIAFRLLVLLPLGLILVTLGATAELCLAMQRLHRKQAPRVRQRRALPPPPPRPVRMPPPPSVYPVRHVLVKGHARRTTSAKGLPSTGMRPKVAV